MRWICFFQKQCGLITVETGIIAIQCTTLKKYILLTPELLTLVVTMWYSAFIGFLQSFTSDCFGNFITVPFLL